MPNSPTVPVSYPHSPDRYAADIQRASECLSRRGRRQQRARTYHVIIRYEPMHREIAYSIQAPNSLSANLAALEIAGDLGEGYRVMRVEEQQ